LGSFVLTDTVGFIQKLPTQLVAAFKATLEELQEAALLLHVTDASHPRAREHMAAVDEILRELDLPARPSLVVLNKMDRVAELDGFSRELLAEGAVPISALSGAGLDALVQGVDALLRPGRIRCRLRVPYVHAGVVGAVYERGRVLFRRDGRRGIELEALLPPSLLGLVAPYRADAAGPIAGAARARTRPVTA